MTAKPKTSSRGPGRPPIKKAAQRREQHSISLSPEERQAIDAARGRQPFASWCREKLLEAALPTGSDPPSGQE